MTSSRRRPAAPAGTAVAYIRCSTEEQAASGAGLAAQRAAIEAAAARHGWIVTEWHADEGVSGTKTTEQRPGLAAALEAVHTGRAAVLVFAKLDRLSRNYRHAVNLVEDAEEHGLAFYACDGTVDMTTPTGRFQTRMWLSIAALERDQISERTRAALAARKAAGVRLGRPSTLPADVVARIVAAKAEGKSLRAIAAALTADAVPTAQGGKAWHASTVRAVLVGQDAAKLTA